MHGAPPSYDHVIRDLPPNYEEVNSFTDIDNDIDNSRLFTILVLLLLVL